MKILAAKVFGDGNFTEMLVNLSEFWFPVKILIIDSKY